MANVRDSDTSLWLHNKLGISNDSWTGGSICSQLNAEVLHNIKDCFPDLQTQVKLKLLLSFFHIPRRNLEEWKHELDEILEVALSDSELWVAMLAESLKTYPSTASLNIDIADLDEVRPIFTDLVTDLRKLVRKQADNVLLPMECHYLNKSALVSVVGERPALTQHFTVRKKPKSVILRADLLQKASDAASNLKKSSAPVIPVRSRGMPRKMTDTTPLKGIPSRTPLANFKSALLNANVQNRPPLSRLPLNRKEGGVKLLDIADQPLGYAAAKKRKRMQELEEAKKIADAAAASAAAAIPVNDIEPETLQPTTVIANPPSVAPTPDYAAGLAATPAYAPPPTPQLAMPATPAPPTVIHTPVVTAVSSVAIAAASNSSMPASPQPVCPSPPRTVLTNVATPVVSATPTAVLVAPSTAALKFNPQTGTTTLVTSSAANVVGAAPASHYTTLAMRPVPPLLPTTPQAQRTLIGTTTNEHRPVVASSAPAQTVIQQHIKLTPITITQRPNQAQATVTHIRIQPQPSANSLRRGLALTREQMLEAQDMFRTANKVTRPEKALILGFMAGSRDNPCPHLGNIVTIKLSEDQENVMQPDESFVTMLAETHFQMNYNNGEWKRIKKYKHIDPMSGVGQNVSTGGGSKQTPTTLMGN